MLAGADPGRRLTAIFDFVPEEAGLDGGISVGTAGWQTFSRVGVGRLCPSEHVDRFELEKARFLALLQVRNLLPLVLVELLLTDGLFGFFVDEQALRS